jgi:hypothetical protein
MIPEEVARLTPLIFRRRIKTTIDFSKGVRLSEGKNASI